MRDHGPNQLGDMLNFRRIWGDGILTSETRGQGLSLYDAARAKGVTFASEAAPQDRFINANGMRFHYLEWGDPQSPP